MMSGGVRMSDLKEIKLFLYTIEEFKRFSDYFNVKTDHSLTDGYTQDEYIATQTKLIILRKYGSKPDAVYIRKILEMAINEFPESADIFAQLLDEYNTIENRQIQTILADGTKINLRQSIEDVMYGLYLHADENKIKQLLQMDSTLSFALIREYVESLENLVFKVYDALVGCVENKFVKAEYKKAPVLFLGEDTSGQKIESSPFWSNLYGKDASDSDLKEIINDNELEDNIILLICTAFMNEITKEDYSVESLENLIFPPTRSDWGDFSKLHDMCIKEEKIGFSSTVRYNDKHDMAYVHLFRNVEGAFIIEQPHLIQDVCVITLVHDSDELGWRIFQIGERAEYYKAELTLSEFLKRIIKHKKRK